MSASHRFPIGLEVGGFYRWNSGTLGSRTARFAGVQSPILNTEPTTFAGITRRWTAPDAVGAFTNPSWGLLDVRVQYHIHQSGRVGGQVFLDIFNVANNQEATRVQDLVSGRGGVAFGEGVVFLQPRRIFLGLRVNF